MSLRQHNPTASTMDSYLRGPETYTEHRERKGLPARNFMKENYSDLKRIQVENQARELEEESNRPVIRQNKEYANIESVVLRQIESSTSSNNNSSQSFLAKGSGVDRLRSNAECVQERCRETIVPVEEAKASVPRRNETLSLAPRKPTNFLQQNLSVPCKPQTESQPDIAMYHDSYGEVPDYILSRRRDEQDRLDRERKLSEECNSTSNCFISESERMETLTQLNAAYTKLEVDLCKIPIIVDTPSMIRRKQGIESKMEEVRRAIMVFSSSKIMMK